jgi:hypothetical protein
VSPADRLVESVPSDAAARPARRPKSGVVGEDANREQPKCGPRRPRRCRRRPWPKRCRSRRSDTEDRSRRTGTPSATSTGGGAAAPRCRSLAPFEVDGHKVNLIDTPNADSVGDVALHCGSIWWCVVSAVEGVEVQTEVTWKMAEERGIPRDFINKLDRERASFERTLTS